MPTIRDLQADPQFQTLDPQARALVIQRTAPQDKEFQGLAPDVQDIVVKRLIGGAAQPGVVGPASPQLTQQVGTLGQAPQDPAMQNITQDPIARFLAGMGISGLSEMGGTALGTGLAPFTGPLAPAMPILGGMAGSFGGHQLEKALGLQQPGLGGDIASVAVPPLMRGAAGLAKKIIPRLPGAQAGLHEEAVEKTRGIGEKLSPAAGKKTELYEKVSELNPPIPLESLSSRLSDIENVHTRLLPSLRNPQLMNLTKEFKEALEQGSGLMDFQNVRENLKGIGALIGEYEDKVGPAYKHLKQIYKSMWDDLDNSTYAAGAQAGQALRDANQVARKEFAIKDLNKIIEKGITDPTAGGLKEIRPASIIKNFKSTLRDDELFKDSFTASELTEIEDTIKSFIKIPKLPPSAGQQRGAGVAAIRGAIGAMGGAATGHPLGSAMGFAAGVALPELLSKALISKPGRAMIIKLIDDQTIMSPEGFAALSGLVRGAGEQTVEGLR